MVFTNTYGIVAIHGGYIEPGTSEIATSIARNTLPVFINEEGPHIPSTIIKSAELESFLKKIEIVISIHGQKDDENPFIMVGGLHIELVQKIKDSFRTSMFEVREPTDELNGNNPLNICNRGKTGRGVQFEISRRLRVSLLADNDLMQKFSNIIRDNLI